MLYLALLFFLSSVVSFFIGLAEVAGLSLEMGQMLVVMFLCLSVTSVIFFFLQRSTNRESEQIMSGHTTQS